MVTTSSHGCYRLLQEVLRIHKSFILIEHSFAIETESEIGAPSRYISLVIVNSARVPRVDRTTRYLNINCMTFEAVNGVAGFSKAG